MRRDPVPEPELELELSEPPPGVALEVRPAAPIGDAARWRARELAGEGAVTIRGAGTLATLEGWPIALVRSDLAGGGALHERVHAFYRFDQVGAVVVATAPPGRLDDHRDALIALFERVRPRYRARLAALAQIWELEVSA